jgi:hypothetical protein
MSSLETISLSINPPFAHVFFFELSDSSDEALSKFVDACVKYLGGHSSMLHFSVGTRALHIRRNVSALDFEVAVHMIFTNYDAYLHYVDDPKHQDFVTEVAGMSPNRIVYDSFIAHMDSNKPINIKEVGEKA